MLSLIALVPGDIPALRDLGHSPDLNEQAAEKAQIVIRQAFVWKWKWRALMLLTSLAVSLARYRTHYSPPRHI